MSANNKTSFLISNQVPQFVLDDHETFVTFLEEYYRFLEQDGELMYVTKNLMEYKDIDNIRDHIWEEHGGGTDLRQYYDYQAFLQKLYDNFIGHIPDSVIADKNLILKHAKDFYLARGSEKSVRFLLRILYGKEIEFYYPKNDILKASDGKWFIEKSIKIKDVAVANVPDTAGERANTFASRLIRGVTTNATALVEKVEPYIDNGVKIIELRLSQITRDFQNGEEIFTYFTDIDGVDKYLSANLYSGIVVGADIIKGGTGYRERTLIPVEDNNPVGTPPGSGAVAVVYRATAERISGQIRSVQVIDQGAGFQVNNEILFVNATGDGSGKDAAANVFEVRSDGTVHPSSYTIYPTQINTEANTNVSNSTANGIYESFAYPNLAIQYINTSNLTVSTGPGTSVELVTMDRILAESNVYFETGDSINVYNNIVRVTSSNIQLQEIYVTPGLPGNLSGEKMIVIKKANANTVIANALFSWQYANVGPVKQITMVNEGNNYIKIPSASIKANTIIRDMGILGRLQILDAGEDYAVGDKITFINPIGTYGYGAMANVTEVDPETGGISVVAFESMNGEIPGGQGYDRFNLPTANIATVNGKNADIRVITTLAYGEYIIATSDNIGSILEIKILSGGSGYLNPPILNLTATGDGTAQANSRIVTGYYTYPGRYLNDDGHLSAYNFLEDRDYYQNYSYVIKIDEPLEKYRKAVTELTHPAGMKLFGEYMFNDTTLATDANVNTMVHLERTVDTTFANVTYRSVPEGLITLTENVTNLRVNTGSGASVTTINLNSWAQNSNVYFSNGYYLNVGTNSVRVITTIGKSNTVIVSPGLPGNIKSNVVTVVHRSNTSNVIVYKTGHGWSKGNTVYLNFRNWDTTNANLQNDIYTLVGSNSNYFFVRAANTYQVKANGGVYTAYAY